MASPEAARRAGIAVWGGAIVRDRETGRRHNTSLLFDAKADLPFALRGELLREYLDAVSERAPVDRAAFMARLPGFVLVRIMQAMGTYGLRGFYERKVHFLQSIPFVQYLFSNKVQSESKKSVLILLSPNQSQVDEAVLERAAAHFRRDRRRLDIDLSARLLARIFSDIAPAASVVYLRPALVCASRNGLSTYYKRDTHWSADGNRIVGEAVGGWIATHWLGAAAPFVDDACAFPTPAPVASDAEPHFSSLIRPLLTAAPPLGRMQP